MENSLYLKDLLLEKGYIRGPFGSALKRGEMKDSGIPVYEQSNAICDNRIFRYFINDEKYNELKRFTVKPGDLVISCSGTVGEVTLIKPDDPVGIISQALLILRPNKNIIIPEYLMYFFKTKMGHNSILERSSGSVQVNIARREVIENIQIPCPSIDTQRKIAAILSAIDDKIELNNRMNENLECVVDVLYKDLVSNLNDKNGVLSDLCNVFSGKRPELRSEVPTEVCKYELIGAASTMGYTNSFNFDEKILVTGRVGTHGVIQRFNTKCWASDNTLVITSKYYEFVAQILKRIDYKAMNRGSTQPLITQGDLKKVGVSIPSVGLLNDFEDKAKQIMTRYEANKIENKRLTELRDTLLPKLMSGEIDVSKVEI